MVIAHARLVGLRGLVIKRVLEHVPLLVAVGRRDSSALAQVIGSALVGPFAHDQGESIRRFRLYTRACITVFESVKKDTVGLSVADGGRAVLRRSFRRGCLTRLRAGVTCIPAIDEGIRAKEDEKAHMC